MMSDHDALAGLPRRLISKNESREPEAPELTFSLDAFWSETKSNIESLDAVDEYQYKSQELPLTRVKRLMKLDDHVKLVSIEAPIVLAKASELMIQELCLRSWKLTSDSNRRVLQATDIQKAAKLDEMFDFLIDILTAEDLTTHHVEKMHAEKPSDSGVKTMHESNNVDNWFSTINS